MPVDRAEAILAARGIRTPLLFVFGVPVYSTGGWDAIFEAVPAKSFMSLAGFAGADNASHAGMLCCSG
jgi:hypothetical protein